MRDQPDFVAQSMLAPASGHAMIAHLEQLFAARTAAEIWALHVNRMADFGFDRLIYGFTRFRQNGAFGTPDNQQILTNHDPAYLEAYLASNAYRDGHMVKLAAENEGAFSWSLGAAALRTGRLTEAEKRVAELNRRFDVVAGYAIGFREAAARAKGGISLCAARGISQKQVDAIWQTHGREILVSNQCMHLCITALPDSTDGVGLTRRQREVLEWVGHGKSVAETAAAIGITKATAEKHLRLARAALGVETTAQAVLKASLSHQIYVSP